MTAKNAFYAQSGGVTAVINASACGVIETARAHKDKIGKVYAGRNGIIGALTEDLIDTSQESAAAIALLRSTPSGAFGSCRFKLKSLEANKREYERLIEVFKAHDIGYFFYNGGGDSADTCFKVSQLSESMGYPIQAIHVPKTVDNDLPITDCCPGFGSVAKYVAVSTLEASFDVRSMAATSTKVFVIEVMGRHAGWIAAAGGLVQDHGIPVIVLFPEIPFDEAKFLARVDALVKEHGYCTVVVSEGCHYPDGKFLAEQGTRDAFGHAQLGGAAPVVANMVKNALGHKFHWAVADYLQRAARHIASKTDVQQAYELGKAAVELAVQGHNAVMPTIDRVSDTPYQVQDRHGAAVQGGQRGKVHAARLHHRRRFRHHRGLQALPHAADPGRGLPRVQGRLAGLRDAEERARDQETARLPVEIAAGTQVCPDDSCAKQVLGRDHSFAFKKHFLQLRQPVPSSRPSPIFNHGDIDGPHLLVECSRSHLPGYANQGVHRVLGLLEVVRCHTACQCLESGPHVIQSFRQIILRYSQHAHLSRLAVSRRFSTGAWRVVP